MKKFLNKAFMFLIPLMFLFVLVSCEFGGGGNKVKPAEDTVNIKLLSGEVVREKQQERHLKRRVRYGVEDGETSPTIEVNPTSTVQYVLMYKSESDIKFTITLDNPKGEAIDAVELTCDDPNSQIQLDGEWENIQYDETKHSIIANWAQENPYKKTFNIKTTSQEDIYTIRVVDIKVNGVWQNKELNKNELKIYKLEESDIRVKTEHNTNEYYDFTIEQITGNENKSVEILEVSAVNKKGEVVNVSNLGDKYEVLEDATIRVKYRYTIDGVSVEWVYEREIELVRFETFDDPDLPQSADYQFIVSEAGMAIRILGTDIETDKIFLYKNGVLHVGNYCYQAMAYPWKWSYEFITIAEGWSITKFNPGEKTDFVLQLMNGDKYEISLDNEYYAVFTLDKGPLLAE